MSLSNEIQACFRSRLAELGYLGKGLAYRKITPQVVQLVEFGASGSPNEVWCDLGVLVRRYADQFDYVGKPIVHRTVKLYQCDFWKRISSPSRRDEWPMSNPSILWEALRSESSQFLGLFEDFPEPFVSLTLEDLQAEDLSKLGNPTSYSVLNAARICALELSIRKDSRGKDIADWVIPQLKDIPESPFLPELERISSSR